MIGFYEIERDIQGKLIISENENNSFPSHFHRNLELIYIVEGEMQATINNTSYNFSKDMITFVPSFYFHEFRTLNKSRVIALVIPYHFTHDIEKLLNQKMFPICLDDTAYNVRILRQLELLMQEKDNINDVMAHGFINVIMGMIYANYEPIEIKQTKTMSLYLNVLTYINNNYFEDLSLAVIASKLGYNRQYISQVFHQGGNENFSNYLNTIRIQHFIAKASLVSKPDIQAIALECGFTNISTFYRCFKRIYNTSPKEFFKQTAQGQTSFNKRKYADGVEVLLSE